MDKSYPCVEINLKNIAHNIKQLIDLCNIKEIKPVIVTKSFCAEKSVVETIIKEGIKTIADARMKNIMKIQDLKCEKLLLRIPMKSEVSKVIEYSDVSLNSEVEIIKELSKEARKVNKIHKIILMVDLGDLREGVLPKDALSTVKEIIKLPNLKFIGLGTNLTCYGGVIPDENNLGKLLEIKNQIEKELKIKVSIVSGGNSSSLHMIVNDSIPKGINQLRIGEAAILGRETAYGQKLNDFYEDSITLVGEIIELKEKPSMPEGNIGLDAFGNKPSFEDKGIMKRAILALGQQDIKLDGLIPKDNEIEILGASSDHLLLDLTKCKNQYKIGDTVEFNMNYGCLLTAMTSEYITKYSK
ncbi:alanine racemase [Clostridium botulinum]|uniref:ornithine racemase Orr n=1 Tax=Clostridium botulinum TaxID=1491 RepID=UPI0013FBA85A|nr:ornithine racemase Orr [Clostridium botulinum]MBN3409256.1 alanine racemase [Clostridium botulinum]MBY6795715.1 alanine/ornithine racemase family PLP-dependent enzyme [Clostridium botulinum]MBY6865354.1 alanine/ornithine racemase family PLP-dependent enzyme [Clostridium botulinum]MBY6871953.1 alanine/ornithine racemase family PLP-dependent enzyme [Clostridium botulinum]MBY6887180.1 alanine/ornithine racemase family PLP-dependent enzyme [Clostridium botulinum]